MHRLKVVVVPFSFPSVRMFDDVSYLLSFMDEFRRVRDKRSQFMRVYDRIDGSRQSQ